MSARLSQLENHQPDIAEFIAGDSLISMAIHSLKITHNVSVIMESIIHNVIHVVGCL